jgi:hypothetical protein
MKLPSIPSIATTPVPAWARLLLILAAGAIVFVLGVLHGERVAGERELAAAHAQAAAVVKVAQAQNQVFVKTEVKWRDRIRTVYVKGEEIEKRIPEYVTPADDGRFGVNAGFVRIHDQAWGLEAATPAADSDREPAGIPLSQVSEVDAYNAKACLAWRDLALGLREFYNGVRDAADVDVTPSGGEPVK